MEPSDNDKINKSLSKIGRSFKPQPDFEKWCQQNPQALEALRSQAKKNKKESDLPKTQLWRTIMKSKLTKLAAAAVIMIAVIIGLNFLGVLGKGGVAWADVVKPIFTAKTAKLDLIIGQEGSGAVITDMVKGSRIRRTVAGINQAVIIDLKTSKVLTLENGTKTAIYIDLKNLPQIKNYLELLRNLISRLESDPKFEVKKLGEKNIDGKEAVGFLATRPGVEVTIWADAQTASPIQIEQKENNLNIICKNFQFDSEMDDSLFSMDVPAGYTVQQMNIDLTGSTEEEFIAGLKMLAEITDTKTFPQDISIEYTVKNILDIDRQIQKSAANKDEEVQMGMKLGRMMIFLRFFKGEGQWHYAGDGVKLGDATKAIFWYKPKDSNNYRVIYGDLNVKDVNEQDLPK